MADASFLRSLAGAAALALLFCCSSAFLSLVLGSADAPSDEEIELLQALPDHAVIALENARLYREQERRPARLRTARPWPPARPSSPARPT